MASGAQFAISQVHELKRHLISHQMFFTYSLCEVSLAYTAPSWRLRVAVHKSDLQQLSNESPSWFLGSMHSTITCTTNRLHTAKHIFVLVPMKSDFPHHDGVGAGMVRDGLCVVARDHAGHALREPGVNTQGLRAIPAQSKSILASHASPE